MLAQERAGGSGAAGGSPGTGGAASLTGTGGTARVGGEVTWTPTANAVVDLTADTDFAQAEVDRQVVDTSRFGW